MTRTLYRGREITFAGDIPRTLSPKIAARTKARLGMKIAGTSLGLTSEGTFNAGFGAVVENMEMLDVYRRLAQLGAS